MRDIVMGYLVIGALVWVLMDLRGDIAKGLKASNAAFGAPLSLTVASLATFSAIVLWPIFALKLVMVGVSFVGQRLRKPAP
jgi:hypothetical protein